MKIFFHLFLFILLLISSCQESGQEQEYYVVEEYRKDTLKKKKSNTILAHPGFQNFNHPDYHLSLEFPKDWNVFVSKPDDSIQIINFYPIHDTYSQTFPIIMHERPHMAHFSIYPKGIGKDLPLGLSRTFKEKNQDLPSTFSIHEEQSIVYLLENHQGHGYYIKPLNPPPGWDNNGFIYAQIAINGFYFTCLNLNTGAEKSLDECQPSEGDKLRKYGNLDPISRRAILDILSSINFYEGDDDPEMLSELIQIESPQPYEEISTPLKIKGRALKSWFHNSEFPVVLTDIDYQVLARGKAKSSKNSNAEDSIPFEVTLSFKTPVLEKGYLILKRANTSGKPEKDRSLIIPVTFPPVL